MKNEQIDYNASDRPTSYRVLSDMLKQFSQGQSSLSAEQAQAVSTGLLALCLLEKVSR